MRIRPIMNVPTMIIIVTMITELVSITHGEVFAMHNSSPGVNSWMNRNGTVASHTIDLNSRPAAEDIAMEEGEIEEEENVSDSEISSVSSNGAAVSNRVSIVPGATTTMEEKAYQPASVEVQVGDTVIWTNDDDATHTVTSISKDKDGNQNTKFDSSLIAAGESYEHTFNSEGEFPYFCTLHPNMIGKVIVS